MIDPKAATPLAVKVIELELPFRASVVTTKYARGDLLLAMADVDRGSILGSNGWVPWMGLEVLVACWVKEDGVAAVGSRPKVFPHILELELRRKVGDDGVTPVETACRVSSLMPEAKSVLGAVGEGGAGVE